MDYYIKKPSGKANTSVQLPSSKSISNRVLIIRALCNKQFPVGNLSDAGDTSDLLQVLSHSSLLYTPLPPEGGEAKSPSEDLGVNSKYSSDEYLLYNTGDGGTTFRFLTAYFAALPGKRVILMGSDQMNRRPVGPLVTALKKLGADIQYAEKQGYPPLQVTGKKLEGGVLTIDGSVSSQFISALLMIAPCCRKGISLKLTGKIVSLPYIIMTTKLMKYFGIAVKVSPAPAFTGRKRNDLMNIRTPCASYKPRPISIEPDWSAASFWYETVALSERAYINFPGLRKNSLQGDSEAATLFQSLGVETKYRKGGVYITKKETPAVQLKTTLKKNFTDHPDLAIPFAVACAGLNVHAVITGISNLAFKESNRIEALITEINKTGCTAIQKEKKTIEIIPKKKSVKSFDLLKARSGPLEFDSHDDHRMAMALAPLALNLGKIKIRNGGVVRKSYPGFWKDIKKAGFIVKALLKTHNK